MIKLDEPKQIILFESDLSDTFFDKHDQNLNFDRSSELVKKNPFQFIKFGIIKKKLTCYKKANKFL